MWSTPPCELPLNTRCMPELKVSSRIDGGLESDTVAPDINVDPTLHVGYNTSFKSASTKSIRRGYFEPRSDS